VRYLILLLASTTLLSADYAYYYSDTLTGITTSWTQNGVLTAGSGGLTSADTTGGSLISKVAVPDGTSDYEVKTVLTLSASGGTYVTYLAATSNALSPTSTGSYLAVELQNPTFSGTACSAQLAVYHGTAGPSVTLLSTMTVPCHTGMILRAVRKSSTIFVYLDNLLYVSLTEPNASGQPGVGVRSAPAGNAIARVDLGPLDRVAPNALSLSGVGTSVFPNRVDMQWQGTTDDANGTGIAFYSIKKNATFVTDVQTTTFSDPTLSPSTTYTYTIAATDFHGNASSIQVQVRSPQAGDVDPRRVGVRPTGSYWGALGEQIDLLSGNLNFSKTLLHAKSRGGWQVPFGLTYNAQNWRKDPAGTWNLGRDIGYGYGWKLLAGSLTPYWADYFTLDHYTFTDVTGAEYRLDHNTNGIWASAEGVYLTYDANAGRLYFPDGKFWVFGSASAGTEQDSGTLYPTLMEDTNGNQIAVTYSAGNGITWTNSSGKIAAIEDVRATLQPNNTFATYVFNYTTDAQPHLTNITNTIETAEGYDFTFLTNQTLLDPFAGQTAIGTSLLSNMAIDGLNLSYGLTYDSSGELTQATLPYSGHLRWTYTGFTYQGQRSLREVQNRYLSKDGSTETTYALTHEITSGSIVHQFTTITDPSGTGQNTWNFSQTTATLGLLSQSLTTQLPGPITKSQTNYTWTIDAAGNPYISTTATTTDPGASYQATKTTTQTINPQGNLTQLNAYDYNVASAPARTYNYTYLTDANYTSRYINNRLATATVQNNAGTVTATLTNNSYDNTANSCANFPTGLTSLSGMHEHDAAYDTTTVYRGNVTTSYRIDGTTCKAYDIGGNVTASRDPRGRDTTITTASASNYAAPATITTGSMNNSLSWSSFLGLSSDTGSNGDTATTVYDNFARQTQTTSPYGAVTIYTYTTSPPTVTATINGRWTKTTLDGLGRTIKVEAGDAAGTKSITETQYASVPGAPLGKVSRQSNAYAPGGTAVWTTYAYDALGRTLSVTPPDNSATTYQYQGNTVTTTDPASRWKLYTMDAFGNLTQVQEPNPNGPTNYVTTYTYDILNNLTQAVLTRDSTAQNRTFVWGPLGTEAAGTGAFLQSVTNPENGAVHYTYNTDGTLASKTDAKGQKITYTYDAIRRILATQVYPNGTTLDGTQTVSYAYDGASPQSWGGFPFSNTIGRVAIKQYHGAGSSTYSELYSYHPAGAVTAKRVLVGAGNLEGDYGYDNEGRLTSTHYPDTTSGTGPTYTVTYDTLGRPNGLTDANSTVLVNNVTYGPSGEQLSMSYLGFSETRTYNNRLQLTRLTTTGTGDGIDFQYTYPQPNAGKVSQMQDVLSGEQVTYTYDNLGRLIAAITSDNPNLPQWGNAYTYDGFGNLTAKSVTKGSAPNLSVTVDPATNRIVGTSYDANGNNLSVGTFDAYNRLHQGTDGTLYDYAPDNKRVAIVTTSAITFYYWSPSGQRLGAYQPGANGLVAASTNLYFGGRLISAQGHPVLQDRLGSNVSGGRRYYPYGEEKGTATANGIEKFATYFRDTSGTDYADQRYYASAFGRFLTPDPDIASAKVADPLSWNRYAFVENDPANQGDPTGLSCQAVDEVWRDNGDGSGCDLEGVSIYANTDLTFSNTCATEQQLYPYGCDRPLDPYGQAALGMTGDLLNSVSVGVFGYYNGGVLSYDSNNGWSSSGLPNVDYNGYGIGFESLTSLQPFGHQYLQ
jgi:RHS repeat-associated protein